MEGGSGGSGGVEGRMTDDMMTELQDLILNTIMVPGGDVAVCVPNQHALI